MRYTVIQPAYFPNLRTMARIYAADVVVWADSFLYKKHSTINRCHVKTASGPHWLTVPILTKKRSQQPIAHMKIDPQHYWKRTHLKSLQVNYQNSPYYFFFADALYKVLHQPWEYLNKLNLETLHLLTRMLRLPATVIPATELPQVNDRSERVLLWADATKCQEYLVEESDLSYIDGNRIKQSGVNVRTLGFSHPHYPQLFGDFCESLSTLDLLFNMGESSRMVLKSAINMNEA